MRILEVDTSAASTPSPDKLLGMVEFLAGRAEDTNATKQISKDAFMQMAKNLGININASNLQAIVEKPPLNNVLEPFDPNSSVITFKGANIGPTQMPVNKAQDIVAAAAKKAARKDRGI
jgi:hypothetical protein